MYSSVAKIHYLSVTPQIWWRSDDTCRDGKCPVCYNHNPLRNKFCVKWLRRHFQTKFGQTFSEYKSLILSSTISNCFIMYSVPWKNNWKYWVSRGAWDPVFSWFVVNKLRLNTIYYCKQGFTKNQQKRRAVFQRDAVKELRRQLNLSRSGYQRPGVQPAAGQPGVWPAQAGNQKRATRRPGDPLQKGPSEVRRAYNQDLASDPTRKYFDWSRAKRYHRLTVNEVQRDQIKLGNWRSRGRRSK